MTLLNTNRSGEQTLGAGVINLKKQEKISLTKNSLHLDNILVGLGWRANDRGGQDFDLDASAFMLGHSGRVTNPLNFVYFNNQESPCGSVLSMGDDLTGGNGNDDCEQIKVQLSKIPQNVQSVAFSVTIYDAMARRQNFGAVTNAYIRVVDETTGKELLRFNLSDDYSSSCSVVVARIYRDGEEWKFEALGEGLRGEIDEVCRKYGLNV